MARAGRKKRVFKIELTRLEDGQLRYRYSAFLHGLPHTRMEFPTIAEVGMRYQSFFASMLKWLKDSGYKIVEGFELAKTPWICDLAVIPKQLRESGKPLRRNKFTVYGEIVLSSNGLIKAFRIRETLRAKPVEVLEVEAVVAKQR